MAFLNHTALETWTLLTMLVTFSLDCFNFVFGEKNMHYLRNNKIRILMVHIMRQHSNVLLGQATHSYLAFKQVSNGKKKMNTFPPETDKQGCVF